MSYTNFPNGLTSMGVPLHGDLGFGTGEIKRLVTAKTTADAYYTLMNERGVKDSDIYTTLATAEAALTTNRNDTVLIYPGAHGFTTKVVWDMSNSRLFGAHAPSPWSNSVRITHSGSTLAETPGLLVSGSDNHFRNIHFQDTQSHADHHALLSVTGNGNTFENCWFEGPCNATQADDTDYTTVLMDGGGNYFNNCIFGTTASDNAGAALLGYAASGNCYRSTFDNCIFYMQASNVNARFIKMADSASFSGAQFFRNCTFSAWWNNHADQISHAVVGFVSSGTLLFDANCAFYGVDDLTSATQGVYSAHPVTAAHHGQSAGLIVPSGGTSP